MANCAAMNWRKSVFTDPAARKKLEAILHPRIRERWLAQIETWRAAPKRSDGGRAENHALAVVVIPLLFETQAESSFDKIICVACSAPTQHQTVAESGLDAGANPARLAAQWPIEQKIARADFVVWTDGSPDVCAQQIDRIMARL